MHPRALGHRRHRRPGPREQRRGKQRLLRGSLRRHVEQSGRTARHRHHRTPAQGIHSGLRPRRRLQPDLGRHPPHRQRLLHRPLIAKAKSEGASVIISSGGASGEPLAWTCSTQSSIDAGYQAVINDYGVTQLDFDIEGAAIADTAAVARQMQAMKDLKAANPNLKFSMTLPVLTSGLTGDGVNIVKAAKTAGIKIDVLNIMAMDYYAGTGTQMGQAAVSAAKATLAQMQSVDSSYTYANLGITPMIGKNDDGSTFTLADAQTVESFAAQNSVGRLAFWAITRDQACSGSANSLPTCSQISQNSLAFTDAFVPYTGTGTGGGGGTTSDFSLSLSPGSASVTQGGSATSAVSTAVTSGSAESVSLSASGAPSGVSVSLSPNSVTSGEVRRSRRRSVRPWPRAATRSPSPAPPRPAATPPRTRSPSPAAPAEAAGAR
ncbi:hypothetical protein ACRAWF_39915 [Streptomyces sp. L7]